jgi:type IV secretory pathway VirB6-like protein
MTQEIIGQSLCDCCTSRLVRITKYLGLIHRSTIPDVFNDFFKQALSTRALIQTDRRVAVFWKGLTVSLVIVVAILVIVIILIIIVSIISVIHSNLFITLWKRRGRLSK